MIAERVIKPELKEEIVEKAYQKLVKLHKEIRSISPRLPTTLTRLSNKVEYKEWLNGRIVKRAVIFSPVIHGCEYRQKTGGCFPCGEVYGIGLSCRKVPAVVYLKPVIDQIIKWELKIDEPPEWICWYIEGSNLNPKEFPREALQQVLTLISTIQSVKRITIESRPEFVTEDVLDLLERIGMDGECEIEIGIGLESYNDVVRNYCFNKGFTWKSFKSSVERIKERDGLRSLSYVALKPPFLDEREAIEDAIETISKCFEIGVDAVSLELMSVQEFTILEYLWLKGLYTPPWLWSALHVAKNIYDCGEFRIGGEPPTYYPPSMLSAHNCKKCTPKIWKMIRRYNETHNVRILESLTCECKSEWYNDIGYNNGKSSLDTRIKERIIKISEVLSFDEYLKLKLLYQTRKEVGR